MILMKVDFGWQMNVHLFLTSQVKPLIWIESVIEKHSHSRIEYMIKVGHVSAYGISTWC